MESQIEFYLTTDCRLEAESLQNLAEVMNLSMLHRRLDMRSRMTRLRILLRLLSDKCAMDGKDPFLALLDLCNTPT